MIEGSFFVFDKPVKFLDKYMLNDGIHKHISLRINITLSIRQGNLMDFEFGLSEKY